MKPVMDRVIAAEDGGEVLNASVFGSFPLSDVPQAGAFVITVAREGAAAQDVAGDLAQMLWDAREGFVLPPQDFDAVIRQAVALNDAPVVIADPGNNAGSGGSVDTPAVLAALLAAGVDGIPAGPVCDPESAQAMIAAGTGAEVEIDLGGKVDLSAAGIDPRPLRLKGRVGAITDGRFTVTGPMLTGMQVSLGPTAVPEIPQGHVVVSSARMEPIDTGVFTHAGLDPARARFIALASRQHFRAGFEPLATHILLAEGPGVCTSDLTALRFEKLTRPIHPLDPQASWPPTPTPVT